MTGTNKIDALLAGLKARALEVGHAGDVLHSIFIGATRTPKGKVTWRLGVRGKALAFDVVRQSLLTAERDHQYFEAIESRMLSMRPKVNYCDSIMGDVPMVTLEARRLLRLKGTLHYFHVCAVPRGQEARQEQGGPLIPGPWAFAFGKATCLTDNRATQERDAKERAEAVEIEEGSVLRIDGCDYRVSVNPVGPWLTLARTIVEDKQ